MYQNGNQYSRIRFWKISTNQRKSLFESDKENQQQTLYKIF